MFHYSPPLMPSQKREIGVHNIGDVRRVRTCCLFSGSLFDRGRIFFQLKNKTDHLLCVSTFSLIVFLVETVVVIVCMCT